MKYRRIYNKEWLAFHPYQNADSVDLYYVNLANKVKKTFLEVLGCNPYDYEESLDELACMLTAWFEDVISPLGIWKAFTTECEKVYGTKLPFYDLTEEYYPGEINVQDIKLLLWLHLQILYKDKKIADPFSPHVSELADALYRVFDAEYETAPENERMQQYLTQDLENEGRFIGFRNILQWFHTQCYLCLDNKNELDNDIAELVKKDDDIDPQSLAMMLYSVTVSDIFCRPNILLGMTTPEWMSRIFTHEPLKTLARELRFEGQHEYMIEAEDEKYVHLIQSDEDGRRRFKMLKSSIESHRLPKDTVLGSRCFTSLVLFDGEYVQNGSLMISGPKPDNDAVIEEANELEQHPEREATANTEPRPDNGFVAATGGKGYAFFRTKDEAREFFHLNMPWCKEDGLNKWVLSVILRPSICIYDENYGLVTMPVAEYLKVPDNPYYKEAPDNLSRAITLLCGRNDIPYSVVCKMNKLGLLDCARHHFFTGTDEELRKHNQFIIDYFYHQHQ